MTDFIDDAAADDLGAAEDLAPDHGQQEPGPPQGAPVAPGPASQAPPSIGQPVRRLYRSRQDRKISGVAGGLAEYLGLDPTIVRLAFVLLAFTGVFVLGYFVAWIVVPERPLGQEPDPPTRFANADRNVQVAVGVAAIALAIGIVSGSWVLLAFALIGGGVWLLTQQPGTPPDRPAPTPIVESPYEPPPGPIDGPSAPGAPSGPVDPPAAPAAPQWPEPVPPAPKEPQIVTRIALSLLLLIAGVGLAAAAGDWWDVSPTRLLGLGVVTIGVGVVVGVIRGGGARGLIPLGIITTLLLIPMSALDGLIDDGVGDTVYRPATLEELQSSYRLGIGELTVDLSELDLNGESRTIDVELGIGHARVILPSDVGGTATIDANAGEIDVDVPGFLRRGDDLDGFKIDSGTISLAGENGELELDFHVGFGVAELDQRRD